MRYPLNKKVRLQGKLQLNIENFVKNFFYIIALQVMLSAKLAEGKLRIVDTEAIDVPKTNYLAKIFDETDASSRILFIHSYTPDQNFLQAVRNIKRVETCAPNVKKFFIFYWFFNKFFLK